MKKVPLYFVTLFCVIILEMVASWAVNYYTVGICDISGGSKNIKQQVRLVENKYSLIPVKVFANLIDCKYKWINESRKVIVNYKTHSLELFPDSGIVVFNNKKVDLKIKSRIYKDTFYIPVRAVSQIFGIGVDWVEKTKTIIIKSDSTTKGVISQKTTNDKNSTQINNQKQVGNNIQAINQKQTSNKKIENIAVVDDFSRNRLSSGVTRGELERNELQEEVNMKFAPKSDYVEIEFDIKKMDNLNYYRVTDPDKLIIEVPKKVSVKFGNNQISNLYELKNEMLESVGWIDIGKGRTQFSLNLKGQINFEVNSTEEKIIVKLYNIKNQNLKYHNTSDRIYIELKGILLKSGEKGENKLYLDKLTANGLNYEISFKSNVIKDNYLLNINDNYLKSIQFVKQGEFSKIIFSPQEKMIYIISSHTKYNNSAITFIKESDASQNMIVIDPGHGGEDPGATYGDCYEKELNLDISLRLKKLLDEKNIKNYFTRQSDVFVGLYERSNIANSLKAKLFLSIHNNAYNSAENGTETLFYGYSKEKSRIFAQNIQNKLQKKVGFKDRGIIERPNLVVIRETVMPAALAEIGFITNNYNRAELQKAEVRQKAAAAICDSIVETMKMF